MQEQREHKRVRVNMRVSYRDNNRAYRTGRVCNLSRGGMYVNTGNNPDMDGYVIASIDAEEFGKVIWVRGQVVRTADSGMAILFSYKDEKGLGNLLSYWCVPF
jgi:hypothetical protein